MITSAVVPAGLVLLHSAFQNHSVAGSVLMGVLGTPFSYEDWGGGDIGGCQREGWVGGGARIEYSGANGQLVDCERDGKRALLVGIARSAIRTIEMSFPISLFLQVNLSKK